MLKIQFKTITTPFKYSFQTAHGVKNEQSALLIAITYNQYTGFGEAPAIHYYTETIENMKETLLSKIEALAHYSLNEPERFWHFCHHLFPNNPFLVCALDMAYWDLYAKMKKKYMYELWNLKWEDIPLTDYTIGIDTADVMIKKIKENPYPIYKIKVANEEHIEILKQIRKVTQATLRIDANAAWTTEQAISFLPILKELQIELIEQPLAKEKWEGMIALKKASSIPIIADESCVREEDVKKCAAYFDGVNIKLTKCRGITAALRMVQEAKFCDLKVMMGCMNETEIGTYAIAQFLPLLDYVDMDGPLLLDIPVLKRLRYENGLVSILS
ncbi:MAG: dipeptide epimerase [Chitinophagaceae bacterium]